MDHHLDIEYSNSREKKRKSIFLYSVQSANTVCYVCYVMSQSIPVSIESIQV